MLLYDGTGNVTVGGDAAITASAPGRLDLQLTPASGFTVRILATDPSDPVASIRVVPLANVDDYAQRVFAPSFLSQVAGARVCKGEG